MAADRIDVLALLDTLPVSVYRIEWDLTVSYVNAYAASQLGLKPARIIGRNCLELGFEPLLGNAWKSEIQAVFDSGQPSSFEFLSTAGSERLVEFRLAPQFNSDGEVESVIVAGIAIEELRELRATLFVRERQAEELRHKTELRLFQAQKLESLGLLAAGAAHDFNNLLTLVIGHANLAKSGTEPTSPVYDNLRVVEDSAKQMAELCQQMLAFAGRGRREPRPVHLNHLAQDTVRLLRSLIPSRVALHFDLAADLPCIYGDETQYRQVVLNLVTNALDALADRRGTIEIHTGLEIPSSSSLEEAGYDPKPQPHVALQVSDDGPGMAEEVRARVFEPFFTTKKTGRGLGLAAVQGIVRSHGGLMTVESSPGQGTSFRVLFPLQLKE